MSTLNILSAALLFLGTNPHFAWAASFTGCASVLAIPGNPDGVSDNRCAACNNGKQSWYPCDNPALCYCGSGTIPPQYVLPFTYCDNVVAVAGGGSTDGDCAACRRGASRWYPCDQPNVLCRCASGTAAPVATAPAPPPATPAAATTSPASPTATSSSGGPFATCGNVKAIPGNTAGVTDNGCSLCNNGKKTSYPCDDPALCYCGSGTIPPQYVLPFTYCDNVVAVAGNSHGVSSAQCAACNNAAQRWYPCDQPNVLCRCSSGVSPTTTPVPSPPPPTTQTPVPTVAAPTTPASAPTSATSPSQTTPTTATTSTPPPVVTVVPTSAPGASPFGALDGTDPLGNSLAEFKLRAPPTCPARINSSLAQCGGHDYEQALCMTQFFYAAQGSGKTSIPWRGDCYRQDGAPEGKNYTLGWFDAGDFVKFGMPMGYSAMALAWGALEFPQGYRSGVQMRSLLYNLRMYALYILEGWDPATQRLLAQISNKAIDHQVWTSCKNPPKSTEARPTYYISPSCPGTEVASDTASALAAIALLLKQEEGTTSAALQSRLATAAQQIFNLANNYQGKYNDCLGEPSNPYPSISGYKDELALAATWMHSLKVAGMVSSTADFLAIAAANYNYPWFICWDNKFLAVALRLAALSPTTSARFRADVKNQIDGTIAGTKTAGGIWVISEWGNLRYNAAEVFAIRVAMKLGIVDGSYNTHAKRVLDYILGTNPAGRSYVVGYGSTYPRKIHHRAAHDSPNNNVYNPVLDSHTLYGALVGGPYSSDTYNDDRNYYQQTEVALDYNALLSGALAAFIGTNCDGTASSPPSPQPPPAPTSGPAAGPPGTAAFRVQAEKIEEWWLQITVTPQPGAVSIAVDGRTYPMMGPRWGDHWTASPTAPVPANARVVAYVTATGRTSEVVVREGALGLQAALPGDVDSFSKTVFAANVASALNIEQARIRVDTVQSGSVQVYFSVLPMPGVMYTSEGRALCAAAGPTKCQIVLTTDLESQLSNQSSLLSTSLQASLGSVFPVTINHAPQRDADKSNDVPVKYIYVSAGISVFFALVAIATVVGILVAYRRLRASQGAALYRPRPPTDTKEIKETPPVADDF